MMLCQEDVLLSLTLPVVKHLESKRAKGEIVGKLVLATIDALKKAGCIQAQLRDPQPRFRAFHIYPMEARRFLWQRLLFQYLRREFVLDMQGR